jgi:hypothetical protein
MEFFNIDIYLETPSTMKPHSESHTLLNIFGLVLSIVIIFAWIDS